MLHVQEQLVPLDPLEISNEYKFIRCIRRGRSFCRFFLHHLWNKRHKFTPIAGMQVIKLLMRDIRR